MDELLKRLRENPPTGYRRTPRPRSSIRMKDAETGELVDVVVTGGQLKAVPVKEDDRADK